MSGAFDLSRLLALPFVALAAGSFVAGWLAWESPSGSPRRRLAAALGWLALAVAAIAWTARFIQAAHLPLFGTYESGWSLALATLILAHVLQRRLPDLLAVVPGASAVAAAIVGHALTYDVTAYPLTISERSWVVDLHAIVAWAAFGVWAVSAALALARLRGVESSEGEQRLLFCLSLGFLLHTAMLASGSLYKFLLFGSAWTFDPVETLGFVAWVAYGTLLHLHLLAGWSGRRLAQWSLGLFVLLVVSYRGIVYFPSWSTYHIFDMDLRMHIVN